MKHNIINNRIKFVFAIFLCLSLFTISIGFSALSTSLSVNGIAKFTPVSMIRVVNMELDSSQNAMVTSNNYTMNTLSTLFDITDINGYVTYNVKISNLGETDQDLVKIEPIIFSNDEIEYEITSLAIGDTILKKEEKNFKIKFKYKDGATLENTRANIKFKFVFEDHVEIILPTYDYSASGECVFSGKGNALVGNCADGDADFVNTNIYPFNDENHRKSFVLSFKINSVDSSRFSAGKRDTIFNILYEISDNTYGKYPGVLLRIEGSKWQLQGGDGNSNATKVQFNKNDLINKEIKIIRHNDGQTVKLYYMIGDNDPVLLRDMTNLRHTFDIPLTFGANIDGGKPDRYAYATLENISFSFYGSGLTLNQLIGKENPPDPIDPIDPIDPPEPIDPDPPIFSVAGPCVFNGQNTNITGDNCSTYSDINYINSGIYLYNSENYEKDFDVSFNINEYNNSNQESVQVTLMNAFLERTGLGYGMLLRRANNGLSFIVRDGNGVNKEVVIPADSISKFRIVRKNKKICYSINDGPFVFAINNANFNAPFNVPITFGASIDSSGKPFRYIKGTLSDIKITMGVIDPTIICE